jgi:hypothetical protein
LICVNLGYDWFSGSGEKIENDKKRTDGQIAIRKAHLSLLAQVSYKYDISTSKFG